MPASVAFGIIRAMLAGTAANVVGYTYAYTYDDGGNILTQTKSGALPAETITYTYGPFGQLLDTYGTAASTLGAIKAFM